MTTTIADLRKLWPKVECILEDSLWVSYDYAPDDDAGYCWMKAEFWEFASAPLGAPEGDTLVQKILSTAGPTGSLRECRHSTWGEEGYLFYMSFTKVRAILRWLEKFYDGD